MANETEVKAQIKLQCRTVLGKPFVVVRSFQLTRKPGGKNELKALDQAIQVVNEQGEVRTSGCKTSHRFCSEHTPHAARGTQQKMRRCQQRGAALDGRVAGACCCEPTVRLLTFADQAILENVIFVHQDDSNWPLAEGAVLKKKFDDIFAATKYTKALETIRKIKLEQSQGIREKKLALETLRTHKDGAHKLQTDLTEAEGAHGALLAQMQELVATEKEADAVVKERGALLAKVDALVSDLKVLEAKRDTTVAENVRRHAALDNELEAPMEKLLAYQENFLSTLKETEGKKAKLEQRMNDLQIEIAHLKELRNREVAKQGRLTAEADVQAKRVADRAAYVADASRRHPDVPFHIGVAHPSEDEVAQWMVAAHARLRALQQEHAATLSASAEQVAAATKRVDTATEAVASLAENERLKARALAANTQRSGVLARLLAEKPVSEREKEDQEARVADAASKLEKKRADPSSAAAEKELADVGKTLMRLKASLSSLRRERDELSSMAGISGQMQLLNRDAQDKEDAAAAVYAKLGARLQQLFGDAAIPDPKQAAAKLAALIKEEERALAGVEGELRKQRNAAAALEGRHADARSRLTRLRDTAKSKRDLVVGSVLDGAPLETFPDKLTRCEKSCAEGSKALADVSAWSKVMSMGVEQANRDHRCLLCDRPFDAAEMEAFVARTNERASQALPTQMRDRERDLRAASDLLAAVQAARPAWEECRRIADEDIPAAQASIAQLGESLRDAQAAQGETEASRGRIADKLALARDLASEAATMERLWREVGALRKRADEQRAQLSHLAAGAKSLDELAAAISAEEQTMADAEHARDRLTSARDRGVAELAQLERGLAGAREALSRLEKEHERSAAAQREKSELDAAASMAKGELADIGRTLTATRADKTEAEQSRDRLRSECSQREAGAVARVRALERDLDGIALQGRSIGDYDAAGKGEALKKAVDGVESARRRLDEVQSTWNGCEAELKQTEEKLGKTDKMRRDLDDNVENRRSVAAAEALSSQIDARLGSVREVGDRGALQAELAAAQAAAQKCRDSQNRGRGQMTQLKEQVDKCKRELKDPSFRHIDERFRTANIELRTTEMANDDLNKYHAALDKALMAFHAAKMAEINKVVKELWQKTYRSPDIDHIAIASDAESTTGRSYNYRVVMKNRDAELDMRGRCSAGQKVLACLIIRLALAETFCLNCGILALDEPTTNLDSANSASLAEALLDIMTSRRDQASFQLIVITHDIKFAHLLGQREHCEYYCASHCAGPPLSFP